MSEIIDRYVPDATYYEKRISVIVASIFSFVGILCVVFSCTCKFSGKNRILHPMWASPRLILFLELHPIIGFLIPFTSFLRGYVWFALIRWTLNTATFVLWLWGRGIIQPAYRDACCFGKSILSGDEDGTCDPETVTTARGFSMCDADFVSNEHELMLFTATVLFTISGTMQLANVLTVDWDIINRISAIQKEMRRRYEILNSGGKLNLTKTQKHMLPVIENADPDTTINIAVVFQRLGMDDRLQKICFPEQEPPRHESWAERIHHHPQWAHTGLYRLLSLDPIFGWALSVQHFLSHQDNIGILRIFCNVVGTTFVVLASEVLQPLHRSWCCYGLDHHIWEEHIDNKHYTCDEWAKFGRIDVFNNTGAFPNGRCMHYLGFGELAFYVFFIGCALLVVSVAVWFMTFTSSGDACKRISRRLFRSVVPEERVLMLQIFDFLGIEHGKIKVV